MILYIILYVLAAFATVALRRDSIVGAIAVATSCGALVALILYVIDRVQTLDNGTARIRTDIAAFTVAISLVVWALTPGFQNKSRSYGNGSSILDEIDTTTATTRDMSQFYLSTSLFDDNGNLSRYVHDHYLVNKREQDIFDRSMATAELFAADLGYVIKVIEEVKDYVQALTPDTKAERSAKQYMSVLKIAIRSFLSTRSSSLDAVTKEALESTNDLIRRDLIIDNDSTLRVFYDTLEVALNMQLATLDTNLTTLASMAANEENWKSVGSRSELQSNDLQWKWNDAYKQCIHALRALDEGYMLYGGHCVLLLRTELPQVSLTD